jgi:hypothetical protein
VELTETGRHLLTLGHDGDLDDDLPLVFEMVAHCLDRCAHSDDVALLLSSCRNLPFTVSSMYHDLSMVFDDGSRVELADRFVADLRSGNTRAARQTAGEIDHLISEARHKSEVWSARTELIAEIEEQLTDESTGFSRAQKKRLRQVLFDVRPGGDGAWRMDVADLFTVDLASAPDHLQQYLDDLTAIQNQLWLCLDLFRLLLRFDAGGVQGDLFATEIDQADGEQPDADANRVTRIARGLGLHLAHDESLISYPGDATATVRYDDKPEWPPFASLIERAFDRCAEQLERVPRNVPKPAYPSPFVIDPGVQHLRPSGLAPRVTLHIAPYGTYERPDTLRLGLVNARVPKDWYTARWEIHGDHSATTASVVREAFSTAAVEGVTFLIFPEFFFSQADADLAVDLSKQTRIGFVGGRTGVILDELHNRSILFFPSDDRPFLEQKHRPSVLETELAGFSGTNEVVIHEGTPIGNIAVLVCSDILEADLVAALSESELTIDLVACPSWNKVPRILDAVAIAEAQRLYTHFCIANGAEIEGDKWGHGCVVAGPRRSGYELATHPLDVETDGRLFVTDIFPRDTATEAILTPRRDAELLPVPHFVKATRKRS